jgi:hypothetical protein
MQIHSQQPMASKHANDSLRVHVRTAATTLKGAIERVASKNRTADVDAFSHLVSICGNMDQLDHYVRSTIGSLPRPIPPGLIELHKRIEASVDAAMELAGWAYEKPGPGLANSTARAWAEVHKLLAFVEAPGSGKGSLMPGPASTTRFTANAPPQTPALRAILPNT